MRRGGASGQAARRARSLTGLIALLIGAAIGLGCAPLAAQTADRPASPPRVLHLGLIAPTDHGMTLAAERVAAHVDLATGGTVRVRVHHSSRRGNETAMVSQLAAGDLDAAILTVGELARHAPRLNVFFAPFLAADVTAAGRLVATPTARALAAEAGEPAGIRVLGLGVLGLRHIALAAPPDPAEDGPPLEDLRIRVTPNPAIEDYYRQLGAEPQPLPLPVVRDALASGGLDGADMDLEILVTRAFASTTPHVMLSVHMMFPVAGVVSARTWDGLDETTRTALAEAMERELAALAEYYTEREPVWRDRLTAEGAHVTQAPMDSLRQAAEAWWRLHPDLQPLAAALRAEAGDAPMR